MRADDADPRETTGGYSPPEAAEDHEWWWLATKFTVAWAIIDVVCGWLDMPSPSTGIIAAGFLVAAPPVSAVWTTVWRIVGLFVGVALGMAGAYWGLASDGDIPTAFYALFGIVVGAMASFRTALTYAAVIGAVVASQGVAPGTSVPDVAWETAQQLFVGCTAALAVIWTFETLRAVYAARFS